MVMKTPKWCSTNRTRFCRSPWRRNVEVEEKRPPLARSSFIGYESFPTFKIFRSLRFVLFFRFFFSFAGLRRGVVILRESFFLFCAFYVGARFDGYTKGRRGGRHCRASGRWERVIRTPFIFVCLPGAGGAGRSKTALLCLISIAPLNLTPAVQINLIF